MKFSIQFYDRLNQLIAKGIRTYSRECHHTKFTSSILLKHLTQNTASSMMLRGKDKEDSKKCKNIRMVLQYAQRLLC